MLRIPTSAVLRVHADIRSDLGRGDTRVTAFQTIASEIEQVVSDKIVFLPTYRRIERELEAIFPRIEEEFRRFSEREGAFVSRRSKHYIELVSFGMQDVKGLIDGFANSRATN